MKSIEIQQEKTNTLVQLIKENSELEIVPMVSTECVAGDNFAYWMAEWGTAKLDEYWCSDERIYFKEQDFDSLVDKYIDDNYEQYENLTDDELRKLAEEKVNNYEWIKAIVVHINEL